MLLNIMPHVGIGELRFGMTVAEIRKLIPAAACPFRKGPGQRHATDAFDAVGMHVFYRDNGTCEAIELGAPANPTLHGRAILGEEFCRVRTFIGELDDMAIIDESGITATGLGLAIYCPGHEEDNARAVSGVFVFAPGYYDIT